MKISEPTLFDSNVLVYAHNQDSPYNRECAAAIKSVENNQIRGILAQQNLLEFYSVITDPRRITKPLSSRNAQDIIDQYLNSSFRIIFPNRETLKLTADFCQKLTVINGKIFDIYLVATMLSNGIQSIITANSKDFAVFPDLKVLGLDLKNVTIN